MSEWLDTETKAMLQQIPPEKYAPPDTGAFTLVLLRKGNNPSRVVRALTRIPGLSQKKAEDDIAARTCPVPVASALSLGDAVLGQFELACCDSISIFLKDEIVACAEQSYLEQLYRQFLWSHEFENVNVTVASVPETAMGKRFVDQFLGGADIIPRLASGGSQSYWGNMMRKKARIMSHWAQKIGAEVVIADAQ